ncbi:ATP-binding protein [Flavobacterium saliperosum]|uniref:ATP-binding protein n=1 Tax=Flavobacterium saliperosum TaxID=329186 RepID=UPI00115FD93C|nr:ATP-binding protein [Flavobacterium saliperosum]
MTLKAQPYNYISEILLNEGDYISAINYVEKALKLANFRKVDPAMFSYLNNKKAIAKIRITQDGSLKILKETLRIGDSLGNSSIGFTSRFYLAEYYLSVGDTLRAKEYCENGKRIAITKKNFEGELKTMELLAKIDPKNSAFYNERFISLNDSLQNVERATRNKFARIEFETDEITTQKNLAEAEKEKISAQRWMILGFSLFFLAVFIFLYISHRQRSKNKELQYLQQQQKANEEIYRLMLDQQQKIEEGKQIEKRRISKELHDGVMGKLSSIRMNLFVLGKNPDSETLIRCMEHVDEIQNIEKEIRKISHDLNQNLFADASDFMLMVTNLVDNIREHSAIHFKIIADEKIDWNRINSSVKMQVYRILQEALQNIEKYANATTVVISMLEKEDHLSVTITDDGIGFDPRSGKSGIGHKNMHERAAEINGKCIISSAIGKGTAINLIIPT